jgi:hypothetical protein
MLRLESGPRKVLIDRFPELANFILGSLFFGQFLSDRRFSLALAAASVARWALLLGLGCYLAAQDKE